MAKMQVKTKPKILCILGQPTKGPRCVIKLGVFFVRFYLFRFYVIYLPMCKSNNLH
jgi:hypothetical protein